MVKNNENVKIPTQLKHKVLEQMGTFEYLGVKISKIKEMN